MFLERVLCSLFNRSLFPLCNATACDCLSATVAGNILRRGSSLCMITLFSINSGATSKEFTGKTLVSLLVSLLVYDPSY